MSLFPAYSDKSDEPVVKQEKDEGNWLQNSSFHTLPQPSTSSDKAHEDVKREESTRSRKRSLSPSESKSSRSHKKKKKKKTREEEKAEETKLVTVNPNDPFVIDKNRDIGFLSVKTLKGRSKPRYNIYLSYGLVPKAFKNKLKKIERYFNSSAIDDDKTEEEVKEDEVNIKNKIEDLNKNLDKNVHDVATWIELAEFQDEYYKIQHVKYKSNAERERAVIHRKLNILDKAMGKNKTNEELQKLWLDIVIRALPSEEASNKIENILSEIEGSILLWFGLIITTQHSLARSNFPDITKLYTRAILSFQQSKSESLQKDYNILELLFHYCKFLDHSGQWELLISIIKINLQFNINQEISFDNNVTDEKSKELEDKILEDDKVPLWHLWNRLEELREGIHFIPVANSEEYPQRSVSSDSFINFVIHFHPELHFQLTVMSLLLLKVPLLPTSDVLIEFLSKNKLPWILDSVELVLSSVFISPIVKIQTRHLKHLYQLTRGPQYLRRFHGQPEFLDLICQIFEGCIKCLKDRQKVAVSIWWLRFQRWINLLDKYELSKLPPERRKAKVIYKDFLKSEDNRDNPLYYCEYSLLEFDQNSAAGSIKTLQTVISSRPTVLNLSNTQEQGDLCYLYRNLCEMLIVNNQKENAMTILINLANGMQIDKKPTVNCSLNASKKFENLSIELIQDLKNQKSDLEDLMLPIFAAEWISCYFWFIALIKPMSELKSCKERIMGLLDENVCVIANRVRECLYENIITIYWVLESHSQKDMHEFLKEGFSKFPKNLTFLSFMASNELETFRLWPKTVQFFLTPPTVPASIMLSCIALEKFLNRDGPLINRVKGLLHRLSLDEGRLSSIIHGLNLRFLHRFQETELKQAHLQALDSCPWNKRVYTDSVLFLPAEIMQLTDVLIEKEFRIHITPDELQELRG